MKYNDISVEELHKRIENGEEIELLDIRTNQERDLAHIGGYHLPMSQLQERWSELDKEKPLVVYCHHGIRSQAVCEALSEQAGFKNLYNLVGGIAAWSQRIDPKVNTY